MPEPGRAVRYPRLRNLLSGRGRWSACRLTMAIILAIPCGVLGLIVADLAAWVSSASCTDGDLLPGLGRIALVGVVAGGVPVLVAGFRPIALLPFAIGSGGPALIFVVFFFTQDQSSECLARALGGLSRTSYSEWQL